MDCDILILNGMLLPTPGKGSTIDNGFIAVKEGLIAQVGKTAELSPALQAKKTINAKGCLVMPGLVNTHCHAAMTLFRGLADDLPLMTWLNEYIFPAEAKFVNKEMVYWSSKLAAAEMIMSGTTMVADGYFLEDEAATAFQEAGLRAVAAQGVIDFPAPGVPDPCKNIQAAASFINKWQNNELISPAVFCHSPYTCSTETIKKAKMLANDSGCKFFIHVAESQLEVSEIKEKYGKTPLRYLYDIGVLDKNTICVHCVWLDQEEIRLLKESGACVATCPESNMKLASGTAPVQDLINAGVPLGLGTDGCASNNNLDLLQEMDFLAKLHKLKNLSPTAVSAKSALQMATRGGAGILGFKNLGKIQKNMLADLIIIDLQQPHLTPFYNSDLIVYAAHGADVRTVIINGKVVMEDRKILSFDLTQTMKKINELSRGPGQLIDN